MRCPRISNPEIRQLNLKPDTKCVIPQAFNRLVKLGESEKSVCNVLPPLVIHTNSFPNTRCQPSVSFSKETRESNLQLLNSRTPSLNPARWRNRAEDSNKTPFAFLLSKTLMPNRLSLSNSLGEKSNFSLYKEEGEFLSLSTRRNTITN